MGRGIRKIRVITIAMLGIVFLLAGCKKEEEYDPEKFLIGKVGGETEYQDALTEVTKLTYTIYSDMMPEGYTFEKNSDGASLEVDLWGLKKGPAPIDEKYMSDINKWVDSYDIRKWDGFSMTDSSVLDGGGFRMEIELATGESIYASGSNAYPDNYNEAVPKLNEIISSAIEESGISTEIDEYDGTKYSDAEELTDEMFD